MKKEVSEHIAKAFFDTKRKKKEETSFIFYIVVSLLSVAGLLFVFSILARPGNMAVTIGSEKLLFEKHDGPYVLSFNFKGSSSKVESLAIDMPEVDLTAYKRLNFTLRLKDADAPQLGAVKIGLVNRRNELSSLYLTKINHTWKKLSLLLSDFSKIQDWAHPAKIIFTLEEWNVYPKRGELLIDGIEFSKN